MGSLEGASLSQLTIGPTQIMFPHLSEDGSRIGFRNIIVTSNSLTSVAQ
jgi:hypothetical protein